MLNLHYVLVIEQPDWAVPDLQVSAWDAQQAV